MTSATWDKIKQSKNFYIKIFRTGTKVLLISLLLNIILLLLISYVYFNLPATRFYSSDGITAPVPLTPLDKPGAILPPDPINDDGTKQIPQ